MGVNNRWGVAQPRLPSSTTRPSIGRSGRNRSPPRTHAGRAPTAAGSWVPRPVGLPVARQPRQGLEGSLGPERRPEIHQDVFFIIARVPGRVHRTRRDYDHVARTMDALYAFHP